MLDLGTSAYEAIIRLKNNPEWQIVVDSLQIQMSKYMHAALDGPVEKCTDAVGYARALRDIVSYVEMIDKQQSGHRVPKVAVRSREAANV